MLLSFLFVPSSDFVFDFKAWGPGFMRALPLIAIIVILYFPKTPGGLLGCMIERYNGTVHLMEEYG